MSFVASATRRGKSAVVSRATGAFCASLSKERLQYPQWYVADAPRGGSGEPQFGHIGFATSDIARLYAAVSVASSSVHLFFRGRPVVGLGEIVGVGCRRRDPRSAIGHRDRARLRALVAVFF